MFVKADLAALQEPFLKHPPVLVSRIAFVSALPPEDRIPCIVRGQLGPVINMTVEKLRNEVGRMARFAGCFDLHYV